MVPDERFTSIYTFNAKRFGVMCYAKKRFTYFIRHFMTPGAERLQYIQIEYIPQNMHRVRTLLCLSWLDIRQF